MIVTITSWAPVFAFSQPTMLPQSAPPSKAAHSGQQEVNAGWQMPAEADVGGHDRAQDRLALSTDVEQPSTEGQPHAETGADQEPPAQSSR
jgi:hypothetical protein